VNFLPWSRFLIIVSSPACIGNRNHFRTHRDQILIGSLVNSEQVNGEPLQKETFTARLLLYVYVGYLRPHPPLPPPQKKKKTRRICINLRNGLWQKWGGHVHPSPPRGNAPGCIYLVQKLEYSYYFYYQFRLILPSNQISFPDYS